MFFMFNSCKVIPLISPHLFVLQVLLHSRWLVFLCGSSIQWCPADYKEVCKVVTGKLHGLFHLVSMVACFAKHPLQEFEHN